ncbi:MAG: hypothetical protein F6K47_30545 [Symploca sp. SIO2E6]|nr:hypothetical protein [Symploca sp. SIO2E6]
MGIKETYLLDKLSLILLENKQELLRIAYGRMGFDCARAIALANMKKDPTNA